MNVKEWRATIESITVIHAGDQLYNNYGDKSVSSFFRDYGFLPPLPRLWEFTEQRKFCQDWEAENFAKTISALFSASQSWQSFLVVKDEKYFCLVYGLFSPPIGQDFLSATFVLSWRQDFAKKADLVFAAFFGKSWPNLGKSWTMPS